MYVGGVGVLVQLGVLISLSLAVVSVTPDLLLPSQLTPVSN